MEILLYVSAGDVWSSVPGAVMYFTGYEALRDAIAAVYGAPPDEPPAVPKRAYGAVALAEAAPWPRSSTGVEGLTAKAFADPSLLVYACVIFPLKTAAGQVATIALRARFTAVSYTHLTLPTKA